MPRLYSKIKCHDFYGSLCMSLVYGQWQTAIGDATGYAEKFVATICQILRLKCTKFKLGWGYAPDPAGGAYSAVMVCVCQI